MVRPILEYAQTAWCPHYEKDINKIENVQRRALKMIEGFKDLSYAERLNATNLSLKHRRERSDLIEAFKILNGHSDIDANKLFELQFKKGNMTLGKITLRCSKDPQGIPTLDYILSHKESLEIGTSFQKQQCLLQV